MLQHTNSSLLVIERMSVFTPTTCSFPHLTIQEFLAAFYLLGAAGTKKSVEGFQMVKMICLLEVSLWSEKKLESNKFS